MAKKPLGQNFLCDEQILEAIIKSIPKLNKGVEIIEIGAGLGDLTNKLLSLGNITAYEVDRDLIPHLKGRFWEVLENGKLKLEIGDILEVWKERSLRKNPYFLVSNLPYYIATLLVLKAIKDPMCQGCVVMTQKEVALKFCAVCKEVNFSALSVLAESVGEAKLLFCVPKEAFIPQPKITSAVFLIQKTKDLEPDFLEHLERLLKISFAMPRKTLQNNLNKGFDKDKVEQAFKALKIDSKKRPHEIDISTYHRLLNFL